MFGESDCLEVEHVGVFWNTLFQVGISFVFVFVFVFQSSPFSKLADLICSLWPRRWQAVHRRAPRASCDPNPPTYCSNRVPRQTKSCFILFINREEGGLLELGREWGVLWRRNAIHIMSGTLTFQRSRNACKPQTSGKMWTPGTW